MRQPTPVRKYAEVFERATSAIEAEAGRDVVYARRSIDRLLDLQIKPSH